jgi:para-nitrobenzyl esterase
MAFIFGDWAIGFIRGGELYDPATNPGRDKLSNAMMSYWANFAYTGDPGRGRNGDLPEWQPWQNGDGNAKMIILDSDAGGGIRMSSEEVTLASMKAEFQAETFTDLANRCLTYRDTFGGIGFDRDEYLGLGCSADSIPASSGDSD